MNKMFSIVTSVLLLTMTSSTSAYLWYQAPIAARDSQLTPNKEVRTPAGGLL